MSKQVDHRAQQVPFQLVLAILSGALGLGIGTDIARGFIPPKKRTGYIHGLFSDILLIHHSGNIKQRNREMMPLRMLLDDLEVLRKKDPAVFKKLIKRLPTAPAEQYVGYRFEIHIASHLIAYGIEFNMPDPPDFVILNKGMESKLECSSRQLMQKKSKEDMLKTIRNTIQNKHEKGYLDNNSCLIIDITMVSSLEYSVMGEHLNQLKEDIRKMIEAMEIGSVVVFSWMLNLDEGKFEGLYNRIDSTSINPSLHQLLEQVFPFGARNIKRFNIPRRG